MGFLVDFFFGTKTPPTRVPARSGSRAIKTVKEPTLEEKQTAVLELLEVNGLNQEAMELLRSPEMKMEDTDQALVFTTIEDVNKTTDLTWAYYDGDYRNAFRYNPYFLPPEGNLIGAELEKDTILLIRDKYCGNGGYMTRSWGYPRAWQGERFVELREDAPFIKQFQNPSLNAIEPTSVEEINKSLASIEVATIRPISLSDLKTARQPDLEVDDLGFANGFYENTSDGYFQKYHEVRIAPEKSSGKSFQLLQVREGVWIVCALEKFGVTACVSNSYKITNLLGIEVIRLHKKLEDLGLRSFALNEVYSDDGKVIGLSSRWTQDLPSARDDDIQTTPFELVVMKNRDDIPNVWGAPVELPFLKTVVPATFYQAQLIQENKTIQMHVGYVCLADLI